MLLRFTNTALLVLITFLTLTGLYGLVFSLEGQGFELHRWAGWALIVLVPWKAAISARSLKRGLDRSFDRSYGIAASVLLTALIAVVGVLGLLWMWRVGPDTLALIGLRDTLLSWHWMLGLVLLPLFALHSWRNWPRPKQEDFISRRGFLWTAGVAGVALLGWWGAEAIAQARALTPRRWAGSREEASFTGNDFPVTSMVRDGGDPLNLESWRLIVRAKGAAIERFSYRDLLQMPASISVATLDCTVGWYTTQEWAGIRLMDLLRNAALDERPALVRLKAAEGYFHVFGGSELEHILLATHVGGELLEHRHGFPLRAVVPNRRGWFWVKWVSTVEVLV